MAQFCCCAAGCRQEGNHGTAGRKPMCTAPRADATNPSQTSYGGPSYPKRTECARPKLCDPAPFAMFWPENGLADIAGGIIPPQCLLILLSNRGLSHIEKLAPMEGLCRHAKGSLACSVITDRHAVRSKSQMLDAGSTSRRIQADLHLIDDGTVLHRIGRRRSKARPRFRIRRRAGTYHWWTTRGRAGHDP